MVVGSELEAEIWTAAVDAYGADLDKILIEIVGQYKRRPGLNKITRLHSSRAGDVGLQALAETLVYSRMLMEDQRTYHYVEIRHGLRWHIARQLQCRLIEDRHAASQMQDDYFGTDLGL